jgi:hypothetical protein
MKSLNTPPLLGSNLFGIYGVNAIEKPFIKFIKKEEDGFLLNLDLDCFNKKLYSKKEKDIFYFFYKKTHTLIQANKLKFKPNKLHINIGDFIMEINCYKDKIVCEKPQIKEMKCLLIEIK